MIGGQLYIYRKYDRKFDNLSKKLFKFVYIFIFNVESNNI